ncbi:MAG: cysteine--tRNA ligase [Finegoldia sp.]|nr:cysteine--tRNA ligase [Finegoldia sp.]
MKLYNTLTRKKEEFKPIEENKVGMYVCGPTVYNYIHVGNARPIVVFDTLRRYFIYKGYDVKYVSNFTDIDDKIINKAIAEGVDFHQITDKYIKAFLDVVEDLNFLEEKTIHPKATEFIEKMIDFVKDLVDNGSAYEVDGNVYFDITKAEGYGKLSKKNIEDLQAGARVDVNDEKRSPLDFALWKKRKEENEPAWESPWGLGRPGWHLECSVMSNDILGDTIDIHAGGEDLEFPHHENEIAQSEAHNHKQFVNYWLHNSMITVNHEKMSKSKNNFFLLEDIKKEYDLEIIRFWLLSVHYRNPIDFSKETIEASKKSLERLYNAKFKLKGLAESSQNLSEESDENLQKFRADFERAMDDDINTADAISVLFDYVKYINKTFKTDSSKCLLEDGYKLLEDMGFVLGILFKEKEEDILDEDIERLIEERNAARAQKDFARADQIRDDLLERGIVIKDTRDGVVWSRK